LLPTNWDIDTKDAINRLIDIAEKSIIIQFPPLKDLDIIPLDSVEAVVAVSLILLLYRNIYEVFVGLLIIFLTAFAGKDRGAVPKNTTISTNTNNSICPPIIKIKLDFEKSY